MPSNTVFLISEISSLEIQIQIVQSADLKLNSQNISAAGDNVM